MDESRPSRAYAGFSGEWGKVTQQRTSSGRRVKGLPRVSDPSPHRAYVAELLESRKPSTAKASRFIAL